MQVAGLPMNDFAKLIEAHPVALQDVSHEGLGILTQVDELAAHCFLLLRREQAARSQGVDQGIRSLDVHAVGE